MPDEDFSSRNIYPYFEAVYNNKSIYMFYKSLTRVLLYADCH
jgi:hypothetical protein